MKKNILISLQLSCIMLLLSACSFIEPGMKDLKIRAVELKVNELEKDVKELQDEMQASKRKVLTNNEQAKQDISTASAYEGQKEQEGQTSNIQKFVNPNSSQNQQTSAQKSPAKEALASLEKEKFPMPPDTNTQVAQVPPKAVEKIVVPPKKVERVAINNKKSEKKSAVDQAVTKAGPDNAYKVALNLYRTGKYKEAKEAFRLFLKNFPSSSYVVNALYWLGECDYAQHDYTNAIFGFKDVLARFPQSTKTADALLKTALAYGKLGDNSNAALHVSVLYEDWPNSEASRLAKKLNLQPL